MEFYFPMPVNVPNLLTLSRLLLIPVFFQLWFAEESRLACAVLCLIGLTDFFDGFFARRLQQTTNFGALFDPIADRILALVFFGYFILTQKIPLWFGAVVLIRNFAQLLSVPILIWWLKRNFKVKPSWFAKWASAISDLFILMPFFIQGFEPWIKPWITGLMFLISFMELKILVTYVPRLIQIARGTHDTFE